MILVICAATFVWSSFVLSIRSLWNWSK